MRSRGVIKFVLQAANVLENTDGEQRALRKFSAQRKFLLEFNKSNERSVSVCSDRNIQDHLLIGRTGQTENYCSILTNRLISCSSSVDFSYIGD